MIQEMVRKLRQFLLLYGNFILSRCFGNAKMLLILQVTHTLDQSFAERFAESQIWTETKYQPKSEVAFSFGLSELLSVLRRPNFGLSDR